MKVVYINAAKSEVSEIDIVPSPDELARLCGSHPSKVATASPPMRADFSAACSIRATADLDILNPFHSGH
jgi:hypothetical protein